MIVDVINVNGMTIFETEGYSPIARHRNGIVTLKPPCKSMQPESRYIHIAGSPTLIEHGKLLNCRRVVKSWPQPVFVLRSNSGIRQRNSQGNSQSRRSGTA